MTLCPILTYDKQNMAVSGGIFSGVCSPLKYSGAVFITLAMTRFASILELSNCTAIGTCNYLYPSFVSLQEYALSRKNTG